MRSQLPSEQQMRAQITERLTNDEERIGVPVTLQEIYAGSSQSSRLECVWFCLRHAIGARCAVLQACRQRSLTSNGSSSAVAAGAQPPVDLSIVSCEPG